MASSTQAGTQFVVSNWGNYNTVMTCTWQLLSQNTANNTSTIRLRHYFFYGGSSSTSGSGVSTYTMDGQTTTWNGYSVTNGYTLIQTKDITVTHNNNGTFPGRTVTISASGYTSVAGCTGTGTITGVPTIPRYATVTDAPDINDETTEFQVSFTNPGNYQLKPYMNFYVDGVYQTRIERNITTLTSPYTWELTETELNFLRNIIPNKPYCQVNIGFDSYSGGTAIGYNSVQKKFSIINADPIFSDFTYRDSDSSIVTNITGNNQTLLLGYSDLEVTISVANKATAQKGATMSKYRIVSSNNDPVELDYDDSDAVVGTIQNVKSGTINVYAIDSRGNSTLVSKTATTVIDYTSPIISSYSVERNDNQVGTACILTVNGTFWSGNLGLFNNSISIQYEFKKTDSSTWITGTTTITPTVSNNDFSFTGQIASDNADTSWDLDSSYDIRINAVDRVSSSDYKLMTLMSAIPTISLDKNGVGIMCKYDSSLGGYLQVGGKIVPETEVYSESEVKTNKVWINDKPIYRKMIKYTTAQTSSYPEIATGISNLDAVTNISDIFNYGSGRYYGHKKIDYYYDKQINKIVLIHPEQAGTITFYFEYTKTTD